jgi:hypothetical protein
VKTTIIALACALIAPLAFAQTSTTTTETTTANPVVTKETTTTTTSSSGTVTTFTPGKTIIVREEGANNPVSYVLGKTARVVNKAGQVVETAIKPGARVHVYYDTTGDARVVNRVVVDDD